MEIVKGSGFIPGDLLAKINSPADLKQLNETQLVQLSAELRHTQGSADGSRGVTYPEGVVLTFTTFRKTADAFVYPVGVKHITSPG